MKPHIKNIRLCPVKRNSALPRILSLHIILDPLRVLLTKIRQNSQRGFILKACKVTIFLKENLWIIFQIALKSKKKRLVVSHKRQYRPPQRIFFYLKEHPLGANFRNFAKNLSMATFFIDPQSFFS